MKRALLAACLLVSFGCAEHDGKVYWVYVRVSGSNQAFTERQIEVQGRELPPATLTTEGQASTTRTLCTFSQEDFKSGEMQVRVFSGDTVIFDTSVESVCQYIEMADQNLEFLTLLLDDDGTISLDFPNSSCGSMDGISSCDKDMFD